MNNLLEALDIRENTLDAVIGKLSRSRKKVPDGRVRICARKGRTQYYLLDDQNRKIGTYIKRKDEAIAYAIAQNEYNQQVLAFALEEKKRIIRFRKGIQSKQFEDIYPNMCENRKMIITPVVLPDDEYVKKWLSVEYEGLPFNNKSPEFFSKRGERMRSKSEVIIADMLDRYNVPYLYEFPIELAGIGIVHPDFRILNVRRRKEIIWEHFGMMDDRDYRDDKMVEIEKYNLSGYFEGDNFIFTMESSRKPLSTKHVELLIRHYCI